MARSSSALLVIESVRNQAPTAFFKDKAEISFCEHGNIERMSFWLIDMMPIYMIMKSNAFVALSP
jgi:hypothetical protein